MLAAERIKLLAARTGFDLCGVASCRRFAESEARFRAWLGKGRQAFRSAAAGRRGAHGRGLRRGVQEPCGRGLSRGPPRQGGLLCLRDRLPYDSPRHAAPAVRPAGGRIPRAGGPGFRRHGAAVGEAAGRRGGAGVDRAAVAAGDAVLRHLCLIGRAASDGRSGPLRRPVRRVALRQLPQVPRQLSVGRARRAVRGGCAAVHFAPHGRTGDRRAD